MPFLTAAVVLVGALCVLDLVLTIGVIRRLRERAATPADRRAAPCADIEVGTPVADFETVTSAGEHLSRAELTEDTLVAFFAPGCAPCVEKLPGFTAHAATRPGGRRRVLAAVIGEPAEARQFAAPLTAVARVVIEEPGGALSTAFAVHAYPTMLRVAPDTEGRLVVTSNAVDLHHPAVTAA